MTRTKGVYEKVPASNIWWVRYADATGRIRREKVGPKSAALQLYWKRKTEVRLQKKLPENFRAKSVLFSELAHDAIEWAKSHKISWQDDEIRLKPLLETFGSLPADSITPQQFERWLASAGVCRNRDKKRNNKKWKPATANRYKALISMVYREGIKNHKVTLNPARQIEKRKENNERVRYMLDDEERSLRSAISSQLS